MAAWVKSDQTKSHFSIGSGGRFQQISETITALEVAELGNDAYFFCYPEISKI